MSDDKEKKQKIAGKGYLTSEDLDEIARLVEDENTKIEWIIEKKKEEDD